MKELICIVCPKGCHLKVDEKKDYKVTGNTCPKGEEYGRAELINPMRVITSTVQVDHEDVRRVPVKTNGSIPKEKIFSIMEEINKVVIRDSIQTGDVVIKDVLGLGVDIVAAKDV